MTAVSQKSFSSGELSPKLYARSDVAKYLTGARTMRNYFTGKQGGAINRPGTSFIVEVKDSSKTVRLIEFIFSDDQTYSLEFGDQYIRFIRNAAQIEVSGVSAWNSSTSYVPGDLVVDGSVNYYCILANTNQDPPNATYWYPLTGDVFEIPSPYLEADLPDIRFAQSGDTITLVHDGYDPRELVRSGHTSWVLSVISFGPSIESPTGGSLSAGGSGADQRYEVTAIASETFDESLPLVINQVGIGPPATGNVHTISWTAVSGAQSYRVYYVENNNAAFIGQTTGTTFLNDGIEPDLNDNPPIPRNPFSGAGNFPATVSYYQQKLVFGGPLNNPEKILASRTGSPKNFSLNFPVLDDDALTFNIQGRRVSRILNLAQIGKLLVFTTNGEWSVNGDDAGTLKPTTINSRQHSGHGSNRLAPLNVGDGVLYVQARGTVVREFAPTGFDSYNGPDLTIYSSHLFDQYTLVDWAYQETPDSIIWAVRSDGTLLGFTFIKEQEMIAWHRHDFSGGTVENVCVVPEGNEDVVYLVIKRTIEGSTVRYIERMNSRKFETIKDAILMDSALTYDGRNTGLTTLSMQGGTTWAHTETIQLHASAAAFSAGDVGNEYHLVGSDGTIIRFRVDTFSTTTFVTGRPHKTVPADMRDVQILDWTRAVDEVSGLSHLEGEDVSVIADGFVVSSPNNPAHQTLTVTMGAITLDRPYGVIHVGLPITADVQTLNVDTPQGETLTDKKKLINKVSVFVESSRGIWVGETPPDDDSLDGLREVDMRRDENYDEPNELKTENLEVIISSGWNDNGRVFIRQVDPLPLSILSITPTGFVPYGG